MSHRSRKPILYALTDADPTAQPEPLPKQQGPQSMSKLEILMISIIVLLGLASVFMAWAIITGWMPG